MVKNNVIVIFLYLYLFIFNLYILCINFIVLKRYYYKNNN